MRLVLLLVAFVLPTNKLVVALLPVECLSSWAPAMAALLSLLASPQMGPLTIGGEVPTSGVLLPWFPLALDPPKLVLQSSAAAFSLAMRVALAQPST